MMVEAAGVEPASETAFNREHSCFSAFHFCLVIDAKNGRRHGDDQSDRSRPFRPDGAVGTSLLCDDRTPPTGEAEAIGCLIN